MTDSAPPAPGTPMCKVVPSRLVGPYLTGQRDVLAGYVYPRASQPVFAPEPDTDEYYVISWPARPCDGYQPRNGQDLYLEPIPIPVGAAMERIRQSGERELVAEYDGLGWQQAAGEG